MLRFYRILVGAVLVNRQSPSGNNFNRQPEEPRKSTTNWRI